MDPVLDATALQVLSSLKKARDDVVCSIAIYEAGSVVVDEPAGHGLSVLYVPPEVSLPASVESQVNIR